MKRSASEDLSFFQALAGIRPTLAGPDGGCLNAEIRALHWLIQTAQNIGSPRCYLPTTACLKELADEKIGFYLAFVLLIPPPAFAQMNAMSARPITTGEMDAFLQKHQCRSRDARSFDRCDQPRRGSFITVRLA